MRILLIGAAGTVGQAATAALSPRHDLVTVGRRSGDIRADIADARSITAMFEAAGAIGAVVVCAGNAAFAPLSDMTEADFMAGIRGKLMAQVNVVLIGQTYLPEGASFTLTSGSLDRYPVRKGTSAAAINAGLSGFVRAAALDLAPRFRINLISPTLLEASAARMAGLLPGHEAVSSRRVGLAYVKAIEGAMTGETISVG